MSSKRRSYAVLAACTLVYFLTVIPLRIAAIIFVACVDRYQVSRAIAAYPPVLFTSVRCLMGPVVAYMGDKIGIKTTTIIGCAVSGLGMAACYLAEHIAFVIISFGIVSGFGASMSISLIHHILRPYFKEDYSLVCGISMSGGCLGSFVFPPIAEELIKVYGVSGMFLLIGAIMLNGIPVSLIIQEKIDKNVFSKPNHVMKQITSLADNTDYNNIHLCSNGSYSEYNIESLSSTEPQKEVSLTDNQNKPTILTGDGKKEHTQSSKTIGNITHVPSTNDGMIVNNSISLNSQYPQENRYMCYDNKVQTEDERITKYSVSRTHSHTLKERHKLKSPEREIIPSNLSKQTHAGSSESVEHFRTELQAVETDIRKVNSITFDKDHETIDSQLTDRKGNETIDEVCSSRSLKIDNNSKSISCSETLRTHFCTFLDPSVIIILLASCNITYVYLIIMTITIDLSREKDLPRENEIYLLTVGSVTEIIGNLFLGRIPDKGYLSRIKFTIFSFLGYAVICTSLVWTANFATYLIGITCCGFFVSGTFLTLPGLVYEFIDEKKQAMVQASKFMLYGVLCFTASPLIGYFRDKRGSYTGVLYVQSLICVASALMIGTLPLLSRRKINKK